MSDSESKVVRRKRQFLEPAHTGTDSYYVVTVHEWLDDSDWIGVDLKLADCMRSINLGFGWGKESVRQEKLRKVKKLKEAVALVEQYINDYSPEARSK